MLQFLAFLFARLDHIRKLCGEINVLHDKRDIHQFKYGHPLSCSNDRSEVNTELILKQTFTFFPRFFFLNTTKSFLFFCLFSSERIQIRFHNETLLACNYTEL